MSFNVKEVAQLLKQAKENEKPYVFFTGAGCSVKADVPTATELIQEICKKFPIQVKNIDPEKDKYNYGKYMSALDKSERRELLKPHIIDNKKINWAHIALACLMQGGYIQRVLTFNFDSILSRPCNLLGLHPSIYDFATANPHLYHLINDPSIVHLHGQGTGFVQLNTREETLKHTEKLGDFIASTLNSNPSLFIGYSGNADEFFPLLEKKYSEQHRLIWTGRKDNLDLIEVEPVKGFLKKNNNLTHYIGGIDADDFLIQLAKELECFPPELFSNPYRFLNQQLENIQPYPLGDGLDILENLTGYLKEQAKKPLNKSLYTAVIHKYPNKESTQGLAEKAIDDIMWAYNKQAVIFLENQNFNECFRIYEQALSISDSHLGCNLNFSAAKLNLAINNPQESHFSDAIQYAESVLLKFPNNLNALITHANAILGLARFTKDDKLLSKVISMYEEIYQNDNNHTYYLENFALALSDLGSIKEDKKLIKTSFIYYEQYLAHQKNDIQVLENYISALFNYYHLEPNEELLNRSIELIQTVLTSKPKDTYNLACYYSLKNNQELCKENLLNAEKHNTLPSNPHKHLSDDQDLNNIRQEQWFSNLLERLKEKEGIAKTA
ncbi:SIR2 family protein [Acinetobacter sp. ANC 4173]|uniref:SIR2 family protein n=1 Tax=Acinetobacter sp. ANC 4173 TaxID=2529837 RepID=UPI00103E2965|nr:SIR2 family protein [Acinetobacter sp. ANC 4173]TCB80580.1 hypothetical protein E0H94_06460 [Acinetobacter sp. ANC 4173]